SLAYRCCGRRWLSNLPSFLFKDPGSVLKGGVKLRQRRLVNEVLGLLVTEFVRNFSREDATPYQRGSNSGLLGPIQAVKFIRHNTSRIFRAAHIDRGSPVARTRFKVLSWGLFPFPCIFWTTAEV